MIKMEAKIAMIWIVEPVELRPMVETVVIMKLRVVLMRVGMEGVRRGKG